MNGNDSAFIYTAFLISRKDPESPKFKLWFSLSPRQGRYVVPDMPQYRTINKVWDKLRVSLTHVNAAFCHS